MIPLSTAMWDPKWYHEGQKQNHWFIDKHNVINGLRAEPFILPLEEYQTLEDIDKGCGKDCGQSAPNCYFMKEIVSYFLGLVNSLNVGICFFRVAVLGF